MRTFLFKAGIVSGLLLLILALTAGCTKSGDSKEAGKKSSEGKTNLVVWIWEDAKKIIEPNMKAFEQAHPSIKVDLHVLAQDDVYKNYLITSSSGDKVPDIVTLETLRLSEMINAGSLLNITDKVAPFRDKMNAFKWADATRNGNIYAMPWDSGPVVMFYRRDLFEKAGLPSDPAEVAQKLKTWEDYKAFAKTLKEKTGVQMLADSGTKTDAKFFEQILWQRNQWYFKPNGQLQLTKPEIKETAAYFADLVREGYVYDVEPWSDSWYNVFKQNKVATIVGASWYDGLLASDIDPDNKGNWSVVPMPKWSASDTYSSANDGGSNLAINKNSAHPEEAWTFISFMLGQQETQLTMLKNSGLFPSLETTYSDKTYDEPVPYFNNQPVRRMYVDAVKQIAPLVYTKNYAMVNQAVRNAFAEMFLDRKSVDDVFGKAEAELKGRLKP